MQIINPGYEFELSNINGNGFQTLMFDKPASAQYPGSHAGTTVTEVLRAAISKLVFHSNDGYGDDGEIHLAQMALETAIYLLESKAAKDWGMILTKGVQEVVWQEPKCRRCLCHICPGDCA